VCFKLGFPGVKDALDITGGGRIIDQQTSGRRIMKRLAVFIAIVLSFGVGLAPALSYVESSNGFTGNPAFEGGRTELEFADINNDGNVDILSIGDHGNPYVNTQEHGVMVWFGDGLGNWSVFQNGDFGYGGIAIGDINNDGLLDIGYGMHHNYSGVPFGDSMIEVAYGDGTGRNWTPGGPGLAPPSGTWGMFCTDFADINNDGWLDLASNTFGHGEGFRVFRNQGDGSWSQCFNGPTGNSDMDLVFGDINNDGNADIAASNEFGTVWFGDGSGNFNLAQHNLPSPGTYGVGGIALGDIDNDGAKELAFCQDGSSIQVYDWNAAGDSWVSMRGSLPSSGYQAVQLSDFNSDGFMDIVGYGSAVGTVWTGDGAGNWTQASGFSTPTYGDYQALRAGGDVDHNGMPDIVLVDDEGSWPNDFNVAHCFKETSVPARLDMHPVFPRGGERFYPGSVQFIDWSNAVPSPDTGFVRLLFTSDGSNWSMIADSLKNSGRYQWTVPDAPSESCRVEFSTRTQQNGTVWTWSDAFTILPSLGVSNKPQAASPKRLDLRVSPNPASDLIGIRYSLPASGLVRISIYGVSGRLAATLSKGYLAAGDYSASFDVRHSPFAVSKGVYLVRLDAGPNTAFTKLIIQ
jgi:hypothetical protein